MAPTAKNDAGAGESAYWEYVPKPGACEKCQAMKGRLFAERPGPVHPNCKCEVRQVKRTSLDIHGEISGFGDHAYHRFDAGQRIIISGRSIGVFRTSLRIQVDQGKWVHTGGLWVGEQFEFTFSKFGEPPIPWEVRLVSLEGDNSRIEYAIHD